MTDEATAAHSRICSFCNTNHSLCCRGKRPRYKRHHLVPWFMVLKLQKASNGWPARS